MAVDTKTLRTLVKRSLKDFFRRRIEKLNTLKLNDMLLRKNPYLFRATGTQSAPEIVQRILLAYLSSSDETIFGDAFFEPLAKEVSGGEVSPSEGVDIAIETATKYLAISVKSGPNIHNSSQKKKQHEQFMALRSRLHKLKKEFDAMVGHCYGRSWTDPNETRIYRDRSGQVFWAELTGDDEFYTKLIDAMNDKEIVIHRNRYANVFDRAVNRYVHEFTTNFCDASGAIDWEKLVEFNSSSREKGG